jgi:hypothetical protein
LYLVQRNMLKSIVMALSILYVLPSLGYAASAVGQKADYAHSWPTVNFESDYVIAVGVLDKRPYVLNGQKELTYVGTVRGGFGNPWDMSTQSGEPLSRDIASAISSGLRNAGTVAEVIALSFNIGKMQAVRDLLRSRPDRALLVVVREWRGDTYARAGFFVDVEAIVYDQAGKELGRSSSSHKEIGSGDGTVISPEDAAKNHLSRLLNAPAVSSVLKE